MFSLPYFRKPLLFIKRHAASQNLRLFFNKLEGPSSSSSSSPLNSFEGSGYGGYKSSDSGFHLFKKSASSGAVVFGSLVGLNYLYSSNYSDPDSVLCFADVSTKDDQHQYTLMSEKETKTKFLFGESYRKRVFFNYEKRIRTQSPPEKVFEYFASVHNENGEMYMTPADLMRAVVPVFPPSESSRVREGFLKGERMTTELQCPPSDFFMLFDTNSDGLISFAEYIFFVTLLSIPEERFEVAFKMFDLDNNGEIDREEFKKVMTLMRSRNRQGAHHRDGRRFRLRADVENGGLVEHFFGKDGKSCLQHGRFVQFLRDLHNEILRLEFSHYDYCSKGTISAKDFALSLIASADINHINKLLDRVDALNDESNLINSRITFQEFKNFAELRQKLQPFSMAIFSYGEVNGALAKEDFQRAASQVCGINLTDNVVDIIYHVFDANRDGSLSTDEFVRVVQRESDNNYEPGLKGLISCCLSCCSSTKIPYFF